ncbi:MAG: glycerol-3-phosphate 1-O-acyltransferase PlsY [Bacteroidales bacterium]|jgi:glycerol-3-phosphate acyltransferase PlsY|nr:glycerol-3-phosphate 1-O-acyltransferase PlsY [Bacteroidales bacterium]MDY0084654.1 glycerol-3-phosphate 1-O-acyltransferase PlsY [Bacteroidales bacterium]
MDSNLILGNILPVLAGYLIGSIPTAVWVGKLFYGKDVRLEGSGNAGATNTIRVLGLVAGIPVLLIDVFKGLASILLIEPLNSLSGGSEITPLLQLLVATAAVLGHTFPVFAGFRGGKGVATLLGIGFGLYPWATLLALITFIIVLLISKYVSLSSISAGLAFPIFVIFLFPPGHLVFILLAVAVAVFLPITHRKNIRRLINGTESKFTGNKANQKE